MTAASRRQIVASRQSARTLTGAWGRNQNLVQYKSGVKLGPNASIVIVVCLAALMGVIYLMQIGKTSSFSYSLNDINQKKTQLSAEQDNLKVENARLQSLNNIKNSEVAAAMTTPSSTDYAE